MTDLTEDTARKDWLASRQTGIGASEAAAVLGMSSFASPMAVWMMKTGKTEPTPMEEHQEAGLRLEPTILHWYADRTGEAIRRATPQRFIRSAQYPMIGATPDAQRVRDDACVESKNIGWPGPEWGDDGTDQIPVAYAIQLVVQSHVVQVPVADLAALFRGQHLCIYTVHIAPAIERDILDRLAYFWAEYVVKDQPPPVDGSEAWTRHLRSQFAVHSDQMVAATVDQHAVAVMLNEFREQLKVLEDQKAEAENILRSAIGHARGLVAPTWKATWTTPKSTTKTDWESVAIGAKTLIELLVHDADSMGALAGDYLIEFDELVAKHTHEHANTRRFNFTYKGDKNV